MYVPQVDRQRKKAVIFLTALTVAAIAKLRVSRFPAFSMFNDQHSLSALHILFAFTLNLGLLLLPGFPLAAWLGARRKAAPVYLVIAVITTTAALGYVSFWIFFASRLAGKIFTFSIYGLALLSTIHSFLQRGRGRQVVRQIAAPFLFVLLAGILDVSLFYLFGDPHHYEAGLANARFFEEDQPGDNIIPLLFAGRIYAHEPVRPFCCGDWLSSDRPPLQAGLFLLERPLRIVSIGYHYQLLATALQCFWVCGVWCLLTVLGAPDSRIRQVLVLLICSGFFFYNSVYTWPKLLAAAFLLFLAGILLDVIRLNCPATRFQIILAATCLGLALMAHPGGIFSLPALGLVLLRYRRLFSASDAGLALLIVLAFVLPWSAYQKLVDPPGNRLLKMHLAGEPAVDSRSTWQAITDAYRRHGWRELMQFKLSNVKELFGDKPLDAFGLNSFRFHQGVYLQRGTIVNSRVAQREWIWNDLGFLNVGWIAAIWLLLQRRKKSPSPVPYSGWLLAAAIFNLMVWSAVMFGPSATLARHSSYADLILLSIGLCGYLLRLPPVVVFAVFILEIWNLLVVWAWFPPVRGFSQGVSVEIPFFVSGNIVLGVFVWMLARAYFKARPSSA